MRTTLDIAGDALDVPNECALRGVNVLIELISADHFSGTHVRRADANDANSGRKIRSFPTRGR